MSHMLVLGAYWAQANFEENPIFGKIKLNLEKDSWQEKHM
jgi:hypothetical protein